MYRLVVNSNTGPHMTTTIFGGVRVRRTSASAELFTFGNGITGATSAVSTAGSMGSGALGASGGAPRALGLLEPVGRHPLGLPLQAVDLVQELLVGALRVVIDYDHVEEMPPTELHVACGRDYFFKFLFL